MSSSVVAVPVKPGSTPEFPPSLAVIVSVTEPLVPANGTKVGADAAARNALMLARVPVRVSEFVPEPAIVTPPPEAAVKAPDVTPSITVIVPAAASTSLIDNPVS